MEGRSDAIKVIGIDIGGTSIKGIVMDSLGIVLEEARVNTTASLGKHHIMDKIEVLAHKLLAEHADVSAVGIGTAGRVNTLTGQVVYATDNLPGWQGFHIKEWAESLLKLPVVVDNDVNTALLGEQWLGGGEGLNDVIMLTLGTGVGGANMLLGQLLRGADWSGGEYGHVVLVPDGRPCNCGLQGCVEQYLSGTALVKLASEATGHPYSSGHEVLVDLERGAEAIVQVMDQFSRNLAILINNLYMGINPQIVLIGGGLVDAKEIWWPLLEEKLAEICPLVVVKPATLGNRAGSIGAARLALER